MQRKSASKGACRMDSNEPFFHRRNKDGTIDSICTRCFMSAGTALNESELSEIEHNHTLRSLLAASLATAIRLKQVFAPLIDAFVTDQ